MKSILEGFQTCRKQGQGGMEAVTIAQRQIGGSLGIHPVAGNGSEGGARLARALAGRYPRPLSPPPDEVCFCAAPDRGRSGDSRGPHPSSFGGAAERCPPPHGALAEARPALNTPHTR